MFLWRSRSAHSVSRLGLRASGDASLALRPFGIGIRMSNLAFFELGATSSRPASAVFIGILLDYCLTPKGYNSLMSIAVIGAGASGIIAALQAAWHGAYVTLFEHNDAVGKKLLVTGSGRCNIANQYATKEKYACADQDWMGDLLHAFGVGKVLEMLEQVGIPVYKTSDGWYYPLSDSARCVVDILTEALRLAGVDLRLSTHITGLERRDGQFNMRHYIKNQCFDEPFQKVIVACGGKAFPSLGSRGDFFPILENLGHNVLPLRPALAPLLVDLGAWKALQGVRLDVEASLWQGEKLLDRTMGNLIFTEWGLNGPAVMDLSHHISVQPDKRLTLSLNLLAFFEQEFDAFLKEKRHSEMSMGAFLKAFLPPKAAAFYPELAGIYETTAMGKINQDKLQELILLLKETRLPVRGVRGFEHCQVSTGGVPVSEVDPVSCESRLIKGLYLVGETLDVVGPCGGYNLTYDFASGAVAGKSAAKQINT